ncbi:MAG TPA: type VI secretion system baseplate subunit TssG [Thermoanaerobaculia bacterium]|nr:type VI secretion system baseplate subunit TssG [Thermoanaerobaculia bacterium]
MAAFGWRKKVSVGDGLFREGHRFEFLQAVRLLEVLAPERTPPAEGTDPQRETVRFSARVELGFPSTEITHLAPPPPTGGPAHMKVSFLSLAGEVGPLPLSVTERIRTRLSAKDGAFAAFLDIFHHRLVSLFYRGRKKYRPVVTTRPPDEGRVGRTLLALVGLGGPALRGRLGLPERTLLAYTGLLTGTARTMVGLERLLAGTFKVPVSVEPFAGGWLSLASEQWTRLGPRGQNQTLGIDACLGRRVWDQSHGFELRVGPLTLRGLLDLLPTGQAFRSLVALTRFYVGEEPSFRVRLVLAPEEVPSLSLGRAGDARLGWSSRLAPGGPGAPARPEAAEPRLGARGGARLGWTSWLGRPSAGSPAEVVLRGRT